MLTLTISGRGQRLRREDARVHYLRCNRSYLGETTLVGRLSGILTQNGQTEVNDGLTS
jgi:hypothetical protein